MADKRVSIEQAIYHLRLKGTLDEKWADWFDGFAMASRPNGETLLTGPAVDQAALYGVLNKVRDLNLPLLFAVQTECPCPKNCPRHARCQECAAHHGAKGKLPHCLRKGTKWDRRCAAFTKAR